MHLRKGAGHAPKAAAAVAILAAAIAAGHDTVLGTECLSEVDDKDDSYCECAAHQDLGDELELNTKDELEHVADHEGDLPRLREHMHTHRVKGRSGLSSMGGERSVDVVCLTRSTIRAVPYFP